MKRRARLLLLLPLVLVMVSVGVFMHPLSASAAAHTAHKAKPHFFWKKGHYQSRQIGNRHSQAGSATNLVYNGGPVQAGTAQVFAVFWEPTGTFVDASYNDLLKRYFGDVGSSPLYHNNTQYTDSTGKAPQNSTLGGTWVDTAAYPTPAGAGVPVIFDADIQNEVTHAMSVNSWTAGVNHIFFVFLSLNEYLCIDSTLQQCSAPAGGFCAYHDAFGATSSPVIYAAMPYDGNDLAGCYALSSSPNNDPAADAEISTTSHEQIEAATDPEPPSGWIDANGQEIGDKCAYVYGTLNADGSNVNWNGHAYVVQSEWDNAVSNCVFSGP